MARDQRFLKMQTIDDIDDVDTILEGELVDDDLSGTLDDLFRTGRKVVEETLKTSGATASQQIEKALRSTDAGKVLDAVEAKAREGVKKEVAESLPTLAVWTVAGGIVGGMIAVKGGKLGSAAALGLALWMGYQLVNKPQK